MNINNKLEKNKKIDIYMYIFFYFNLFKKEHNVG